jgi:hypothetical protein
MGQGWIIHQWPRFVLEKKGSLINDDDGGGTTICLNLQS